MVTKTNANNAVTFFFISRLFKLSNLSKISLCFIERFFPMAADSENFLELDFNSVVKIVQSSDLLIDTEIQVFNVADRWLSYNKKRSKYTKDLLSRIRLLLLTVPALNHILRKKSCFTMNNECVDIINEALENKKGLHLNKISTTSRFCTQKDFNIVVCGGKLIQNSARDVVSDVFSIATNNTDNIKKLSQMKTARQYSKAVCVGGEVYVFGGIDADADIVSVERYSPVTNAWEIVADMHDDRENFCACSFVDSVYVFGGYLEGKINSCVKFDIKTRQWKKVAEMNEARSHASCAVFQGRIVVSGGVNDERLNTVEVYDHIADMWSYMPNMTVQRFNHKSVAVQDKLFIVGGIWSRTCEIFDSTSCRFISLKPNKSSLEELLMFPAEVFSVGKKLVVFSNQMNATLHYDVEIDEWSEKLCEVTENLQDYCCAKLPTQNFQCCAQ